MTRMNESISDKPSVNARIEKKLSQHSPAEQTRMLDVLDVLQNAGSTGLRPAEWASQVKALHPDGDYSMQDLLKTVVKNFGFCLRRTDDGAYVWDDSDRELSASPEMHAMVQSQVEMSAMAYDQMKKLGEFSSLDLATAISRATGYPLQQAKAYAEHVMQQFSGSLTPMGDGKYRFQEDKPKTADDHMADLKNLLKNAGLGNRD